MELETQPDIDHSLVIENQNIAEAVARVQIDEKQGQTFLNHFLCRINKLQEEVMIPTFCKETAHGKLKYVCEKCGKCFQFLMDLEFHKKVHRRVINYKCNVCEKGFYLKQDYLFHTIKQCGQSFIDLLDIPKNKNREVLDRSEVLHRRKVLDRRKGLEFICEICSKRFLRERYYNSHMDMHNAVAKEKCRYCPRTFLHKNSIVDHMTIWHTKPKVVNIRSPKDTNVECDVCGHKFISRIELKRHQLFPKNHYKKFKYEEEVFQIQVENKIYSVQVKEIDEGETAKSKGQDVQKSST